ncbi:hypothetical protein [Dyella mobilis]|uniref:Uncharacterized protein n=1 Tax=Dyella mobilis TaxID=1849582 RepID=A0ABS2KEE3_9GAMM|nr:hypothetical protein [Dyella mobilis]MBM7129551.1 hypothetical protein [Dyella mobilis]GLQ98186.1 hypothetical protein GCM10007863_26060 [Dyella mobilis]
MLLGSHPGEDRDAMKIRPDDGYLIAGDEVDLVTTCDGFDYVRFHGPKRVSTGWVDGKRIKTTGAERSVLPPGAAMLCKAAQDTMNNGTPLASPAMTNADDKLLAKTGLEAGANGSPTQIAHVVVDGRPLVVSVVDSGGTSHDTEVYVLSNDLKSRLSPPDRDDRDAENAGADAWGFGVSEDVVMVLGRPMVRSWEGGGTNGAYLSVIDRNGDIIPTCEMHGQSMNQRKIVSSTNDRVCHAFLDDRLNTLAMHQATQGESLALNLPPQNYIKEPIKLHPDDTKGTTLHFHNNERASEVQYSLESAGYVDLDNSGNVQHVGLVSFADDESTAGDGTYSDAELFPVYFNKQGVADLSSDANQKLIQLLPHNMQTAKIVSMDGVTYLELTSDTVPEDSGQIWKITPHGADQVCGLQLWHTVELVRPIVH